MSRKSLLDDSDLSDDSSVDDPLVSRRIGGDLELEYVDPEWGVYFCVSNSTL